jgi:hypothetical protein
MEVKTYRGPITTLADAEVFVFGANEQGFHGAGSAGYASFGVHGNRWREFNYATKPHGWKGKWNEKGKTGPQVGTEGKSYGLVTVTRAGARRSLKPDLKSLFKCCERNPSWTFFLAQSGKTGLNGWTPQKMAEFMASAGPMPTNLAVDETFAPHVIEAYSRRA